MNPRPASLGQVTLRLARRYLLLLVALCLAFAVLVLVGEPGGKVYPREACGALTVSCR